MAEVEPQEILEFWFGSAADDPAEAAAREDFWFGASAEIDAEIGERFASTVEAAARGDLEAWTRESRSTLALVLTLDQFPRNIGRGSARAFAHDAQALRVTKDAVATGTLGRLALLEQAFLILPYQHSESLEDQRTSVRLSVEIARAAPAPWRAILEKYLSFAMQHHALIERFGRFPHRNRALGRDATAEEEAYLRRGGTSFGQDEK